MNKEFNFRVTGTPLSDPENDAPFAVSKNKNQEYLDILSEVTSEATILTSKIAAPIHKKDHS